MKLFFITLGIIVSMSACHSQNSKPAEKQLNIHEVVVMEVLQANRYTYLRVKENDSEHWVALPTTQAGIGKTYYYKGGFQMTDFESKSLSRTFEAVIFIERISTEPITADKQISPPSAHPPMPGGTAAASANIHEVVAMEVLQAGKYTYLRVKENDSEHWVALPTTQAEIGKTYYYEGGFKMTNFESSNLNKTFEAVFFIQGISAEPITTEKRISSTSSHASKSAATKKNITIDPAMDGITIAELFSNKGSYAGKVVRIRGEVTKFSAKIMGKNWIHIQDGTDHAGYFDLTITSNMELNVGDIESFEGKISLNKDLGYGYLFEVLMEDAILLDK